ncbi:MAG: extracellular solute-binding protein [Defluviitaleaceae bacterium]|nr:extracellular solute-binding protein [Defluviitaleaceae bacterium]
MSVKLLIQGLIAILITAIGLYIVFVPNRIDFDSPTREEANAAATLLRSSFENPRNQYVDFLSTHHRLRGITPQFNETISLSANISERGYITYHVTVPAEGLYFLALEYELPPDAFNNLTISVRVNGEVQFEEAHTITLPVFWEDETKDFPLNRFGDEINPARLRVEGITRIELFDAGFITDTPLLFHLQAGANEITITNETSRALYINGLGVYSENMLPHFVRPQASLVDSLITVNAIDNTHTNSAFVQLQGRRNAGLEPFHPVDRVINVADMSRAGDEIFFEFEVHETGYHAITLNVQTAQEDFFTFITVRINGEIPFYEAASFPLVPHTGNRWRNQTLTDAYGEPLMFFLEAGVHTMSIRTELAPISDQLNQLRLLVDHVNYLALEVRRITGREIDRNRTWWLTRYIPALESYLDAYDVILRDLITELGNHSPRGQNSGAANNLITALSHVQLLQKNPDRLPLYMARINGAYASILQMTGIAMDALIDSGLTINNIYIGRATDLPRESASMTQSLSAGMQHLWATFASDKFTIQHDENALNVWVNYSFLHVDILQQMVDTTFTPYTGIQVNLSVMPDVGRLILSRAAGTNPDVALGVPAFMPFEMGARGALYDLSSFDNFWEVMGNHVPGTLIPYIFNDSVFAVPETVGFAATVYRTDILTPLGLTAPDTWHDVAQAQSVLQRFDMSFFKPIASGVGYKWFFQTTPLIYQFGGSLFAEDGLSTTIDQPEAVQALTFLGDLFTTFALAEQVPSFFNSFRFGQTPVGIIDAATYMLLLYTAPELLGQWNLAPFPGIEDEYGCIQRWFIANGTGSIMFDNTDMADEGWLFLQWFLSAETQRNFAFQLFSNFRILWLSSNIEALEQTPIEYQHLRVILDSMQWLRDVPRSPGQYMLERRLSDIWNTMVFEGTPPRVAIDLRVIDINREFHRKLVEFGFIDADGNWLRPYVVRELDWVLEQIENAGGNR